MFIRRKKSAAFDLELLADCVRRSRCLEFALDEEPLFPLGEGFAYTDTGFILAGMVIEAASGLNFYEEALRRFVLPLGLTRTEPQTKRAFDQLASGYAGDGAEYGSLAPGAGKTSEDGVMKNHPGGEWTGGGWVSNPSDLAKWMRAMCAPTARTVAQLATVALPIAHRVDTHRKPKQQDCPLIADALAAAAEDDTRPLTNRTAHANLTRCPVCGWS